MYVAYLKEFDSINHKMSVNGFGKPLFSWFKSYLVDRCKYVRVLGVRSLFTDLSGESHCSHRSPFNISDSRLSRVYDSVNDRGFKRTKCLNPSTHFQTICCKALKIICFLI